MLTVLISRKSCPGSSSWPGNRVAGTGDASRCAALSEWRPGALTHRKGPVVGEAAPVLGLSPPWKGAPLSIGQGAGQGLYMQLLLFVSPHCPCVQGPDPRRHIRPPERRGHGLVSGDVCGGPEEQQA